MPTERWSPVTLWRLKYLVYFQMDDLVFSSLLPPWHSQNEIDSLNQVKHYTAFNLMATLQYLHPHKNNTFWDHSLVVIIVKIHHRKRHILPSFNSAPGSFVSATTVIAQAIVCHFLMNRTWAQGRFWETNGIIRRKSSFVSAVTETTFSKTGLEKWQVAKHHSVSFAFGKFTLNFAKLSFLFICHYFLFSHNCHM